MSVSKADELRKLTPVSFGGLVIPVVSLRNSINPRIETSPYIKARADYLRNLGFQSRSFVAELAFENSTGTYPDTYRKFLKQVEAGVAQKLNHPIYGELLCYATNYSDDLNAQHRSGINASVTFIETLEGLDSPLVELRSTQATNFGEVEIQGAAELPENEDDTSLWDTLADLNALENQIKGLGTKMSMELSTSINKINNTINNTLDTLKAGADTANALAVIALRRKLDYYQAKKPAELRQFVVPKDMSLAEVCSAIPANPTTIKEKNPQVKGKLLIRAGTLIQY